MLQIFFFLVKRNLFSYVFMFFSIICIMIYRHKLIIKGESKIKYVMLILLYKFGNHDSAAATRTTNNLSIYPKQKIESGMILVRIIGIHCTSSVGCRCSWTLIVHVQFVTYSNCQNFRRKLLKIKETIIIISLNIKQARNPGKTQRC